MFIKTKRGFTLIELMIVVAIIGILAAIAIPKFSDLVTKSNEASSKGNLGAIRSALSIYYGDLEGWYPTDASGDTITSLTAGGKYMTNIPPAKTPAKSGLNIGHNDSVTSTNTQGDGGGWYYENLPTDMDWGRIVVNCTHKDTKGNAWSAY